MNFILQTKNLVFKNLPGASDRPKSYIKSLMCPMLTLGIIKRLNCNYFIGKLLDLKIFLKWMNIEAALSFNRK